MAKGKDAAYQVVINIFWIVMVVFSWSLEFINGTPSVGVVGGDAYLNWTISNIAYDVVRYIRNPPNNASVMVFDKNKLTPTITIDTRAMFTGDLLHGIVSFTLSNVTLSDAGRYAFAVTTGIGTQILGSQVLIVAEIPNIPGITSLSLSAVVGQECKLNCSTESRSVPLDHNLTMYSEWKKNGINITMESGYSVNGTILTISNLSRNDNGDTVTCRVFEDQRRISAESSAFVLNIFYGPDNVQVSPSDVLTVSEGGSINITCMGECNPPCNLYYWMKDYLPTIVGSSQSYLIPAIRRTHAGVYTCTVINTNISKNATAQTAVRVNYGPDIGSIILSPSHTLYEVVESSSLSVNCSVDCYPNCQYRWTGPALGNYGNTGVLFIPEIKRDQAGVFTCTATNRGIASKSATANISVTVFYGPDIGSIILSPSHTLYEVVESSSLSVNCSVDCYPNCQYRWTGSVLGNYGNTGMLSIREIKRDQAGVFTCTATNPGIASKSATANISVTVLYPPTVRMESRNGSFSETGLMINCTAHGIPERYIFSLMHSSLFTGIKIRQIINNEPVSTGVVHHWFRNPSIMDTGVYTCIVSNGILDYRDGSLNKNVSETVWITGPPDVTSSDTDFYVEKGCLGRLVIEFYNSMLNVMVTWNKQRNYTLEKLESSEKYHISVASTNVTVEFYSILIQQPGFIATLEIQNVTEEDFGSYQINLRNSAGNQSCLILNLRPRGHPNVPQDMHIVPNSITVSSVSIEWVSGFHGGSDQTFVIEYKTQMDQGWTTYSHDVFGGMIHNKYFNITVEDLHENTLYFFQLYAWNVFGRSEYSNIINATTYADHINQALSDNGASSVILGSVLGTCIPLAFIGTLVVVLLYRRRRLCSNGKSSSKSKTCRSATTEGTNMEGYTTLNTVASTGGENDKNPYLDLQHPTGERNENLNIRSSSNVIYDAIHPYANNEEHAYSSLNQRPIQKGENGVYENTNI